MYTLHHKNHMGRNLMRMLKFFPNEYKFFPQTWTLPTELNEFKKMFDASGKSKQTFIFKPDADCQGRGIYLAKQFKNVKRSELEHYIV